MIVVLLGRATVRVARFAVWLTRSRLSAAERVECEAHIDHMRKITNDYARRWR